MKRSRRRWKKAQSSLDIKKLVFLDETGAKTNMTRRYGWGQSAKRVDDSVPHGHWQTTTLIQAIDYRGTRVAATTNGPNNSWVFETFIDWLLAPALREGDILIMDNLSSHKNARVLEKIEVSTEDQASEDASMDAQRARIEAWRLANDYGLLNVHLDSGLSGGRAEIDLGCNPL